MRKSSSGFTIIELLIVIIIIAILAALSLVAFKDIQKRAASATLQSDLRQARNYMEQQNINNGSYPSSAGDIPKSPGTIYQLSLSYGNEFCLTATSPAAGASPFHISNDKDLEIGACQGHTYGGPAPAGVNIAPPLDQWALSGGATYDAVSKEIFLPNIGSMAMSPYIRVDAPKTISVSAEVNSPAKGGGPNGERVYGLQYFDESHTPYVLNNGWSTNGSAGAVPVNSWTRQIWSPLNATGPNFMYLKFHLSIGNTVGVSGTRIRNPTVTLTR